MEIKNLRYFLAVAREENMSHATQILHVTQPTLSKVLKSLEDELGKKLFTLHSFSIKLTDEEVFFPSSLNSSALNTSSIRLRLADVTVSLAICNTTGSETLYVSRRLFLQFTL